MRRRPILGLAVLLGAELLVLVVLARVDGLTVPWESLGEWLEATPPEVVAGSVLRLVALGLATWSSGTTLVYALARASGRVQLVHATGWITLPAVRRCVDAAFAATLLVSTIGGMRPAAATSSGTEPVTSTTAPAVRSGRAPGLERMPVLPPSEPVASAAPVGPVLPATPAPEPVDRSGYVVAPGDNLWSIAADVVAQHGDRAPDSLADHEIAPYWVALIEANRAHLRSADPDLIFPGELLELPPFD